MDGSLLADLTSPPYEVSLDPMAYAAGSHVLRVEAIDTAGGMGATELGFVAATPSSGGPSLGSWQRVCCSCCWLWRGQGAFGYRPPPADGTGAATRVRPWSPRRNGEPEPWEHPPASCPL